MGSGLAPLYPPPPPPPPPPPSPTPPSYNQRSINHILGWQSATTTILQSFYNPSQPTKKEPIVKNSTFQTIHCKSWSHFQPFFKGISENFDQTCHFLEVFQSFTNGLEFFVLSKILFPIFWALLILVTYYLITILPEIANSLNLFLDSDLFLPPPTLYKINWSQGMGSLITH